MLRTNGLFHQISRSFSTTSKILQSQMKTIYSLGEYRKERSKMKGVVGFVPTMGNLHEGHLNLVKLAKSQCDVVVVSIFVNPAQFAIHEDIDKYPRTLESDLKMLKEENTDYVFVPSVKDMYPSGIHLDTKKQVGTFVEVLGKSHQMEGWIRPHFFRGVATVVCKLFNAVQPDKAFFGQKDAQQCVVVKSMTKDLLMPIDIVVGPTLREKDGLAMSSRNGYLSPEDRKAGLVLFKALSKANELFTSGVRDRETLINVAKQEVSTEPRVSLEYFSLAHPHKLEEVDKIDEDGAILSGEIGRAHV